MYVLKLCPVLQRSSIYENGRRTALQGFRMEAPSNIRKKVDIEQFNQGWMEGSRQLEKIKASDDRSTIEYQGERIAPAIQGGERVWGIEGRGFSDGIKNAGTFKTLELAKAKIDRIKKADALIEGIEARRKKGKHERP